MNGEPVISVHFDATGNYAVKMRPCGLPAEGYGILLYDIARQIAQMFAQEGGYDEAAILAAILRHFDQERAKPTSDVYVKRLDS